MFCCRMLIQQPNSCTVCLFVVAAFCSFVLCNRSKGDDEAILQREEFFCCQSTNPESVPCRAPVWVPIWGANLDLSFSFHAKMQVFNKVSQSEHQTSKMNIKFQNLRKFEGYQTYPPPPSQIGVHMLVFKVTRHVKTWFSMSSSLQAIILNPWAPT